MKRFFLTLEKLETTSTWWCYALNLSNNKYERLSSSKLEDPIDAFWSLVPEIEKTLNITISDFKPSYIL